jgi:hypothetical protein
MSPIRVLPSLHDRADGGMSPREREREETCRQWSLAFLLEERIAEMENLMRDYNELVDLYTACRAELAACKAWFAVHPLHGRKERP